MLSGVSRAIPRFTGTPPASPHQRAQRMGVAARHLAAVQNLLGTVHVHDLVAAGQNRDPRLAVDQRMRHRQRGEHAELRRPQRPACGKHRGSAPDVLPGLAQVHPDVAVLHDGDGLPPLVGVLLPDHAVRPVGHGGAGEDPGRFAGADAAGGEGAGRDLLHHPEPHRTLGAGAADVLAADRVAVHCRVGPGGDVDRAHDVLGQHTVEGIVQRHPERGLARDLGQNPPRRLGRRDGPAHSEIGMARSSATPASSWSHMVSWKRTTRQAGS